MDDKKCNTVPMMFAAASRAAEADRINEGRTGKEEGIGYGFKNPEDGEWYMFPWWTQELKNEQD